MQSKSNLAAHRKRAIHQNAMLAKECSTTTTTPQNNESKPKAKRVSKALNKRVVYTPLEKRFVDDQAFIDELYEDDLIDAFFNVDISKSREIDFGDDDDDDNDDFPIVAFMKWRDEMYIVTRTIREIKSRNHPIFTTDENTDTDFEIAQETKNNEQLIVYEKQIDFSIKRTVITYFDWQSLFNLQSDASKDEIRRAYRKTALKYHPDKNKSEDAPQMFRMLKDAHDNLMDDIRIWSDDENEQYFIELYGPLLKKYSKLKLTDELIKQAMDEIYFFFKNSVEDFKDEFLIWIAKYEIPVESFDDDSESKENDDSKDSDSKTDDEDDCNYKKQFNKCMKDLWYWYIEKRMQSFWRRNFQRTVIREIHQLFRTSNKITV